MAILKRQRADGTYEFIEFYGKFVKLEETFITPTDNISTIQIQNSYSKTTDNISVFYEGFKMTENDNFTISPDSRYIILTDWSINTGEKIDIEIFKNAVNVDNLTSGSQLEDLSVDKHKLSQALQDEITSGGSAVKSVDNIAPDEHGNVVLPPITSETINVIEEKTPTDSPSDYPNGYTFFQMTTTNAFSPWWNFVGETAGTALRVYVETVKNIDALQRITVTYFDTSVSPAKLKIKKILHRVGTSTIFSKWNAVEQIYPSIETANEINKINNKLDNALSSEQINEEVLNRGGTIIDVKHDSMVDIVDLKGKTIINYVPLFDSGLWFKHDEDYVVESPAKIRLTANADYRSRGVFVRLKPNQEYTLSAIIDGDGARIGVRTGHTIDGSAIATFVDSPVSFISPSDGLITIRMDNNAIYPSICTFENIMLNEGNTTLPFVANIKGIKNPTIDIVEESSNKKSSMTLLTTLYDGDRVYEENGNIVVDKSIREIVLGKDEAWEWREHKTGFKFVHTPLSASMKESESMIGVKHNGSIIPNDKSTLLKDCIHPNAINYLIISIPNVDSGWGQDYTPTPDEIKAYFLGWRMYTDSQGNPYNGVVGTDRHWGKIYCGEGAKDGIFGGSGIVAGSGISTLPTVKNDKGYSGYRIVYKLDKPIKEVVKTVGNLVLNKGINIVNVSEGKIVREHTQPKYSSAYKTYEINSLGINNVTANLLNFKARKIIAVFRNGKQDFKWVKHSDAMSSNGLERMYINEEHFDPMATYEVEYIPLEPYKVSAPTNPISIAYQSNIGSVVSKLVTDVSDIKSRTSDIERTIIRRDEGLKWHKPVLINGWTKYSDDWYEHSYAKDALGFVHFRGMIKGGAFTNGTTLFRLPTGCRPLKYIMIPAVAKEGVKGIIYVYPSGDVLIFGITENSYLSLNGITFKAEQ